MPCAGLNVSMTEPDGPMMMVNASLEITCTAPGTYLVPLKARRHSDDVRRLRAGQQLGLAGRSRSTAGAARRDSAADDGIDDGSGLYAVVHLLRREADLRKSVSPASRPATGIASDTGYVERYVEWDCMCYDVDGDADTRPEQHGWITPAESMADNDPRRYRQASTTTATAWPTRPPAQPGQPADYNDVAGTAMCAAILYNEGNAPYPQVQYLQSADEDCDGLVDGIEVVFGSNPTDGRLRR